MDKETKEALAALGVLIASGAMGYRNLKIYKKHVNENPDNKVIDSIIGGIATVGIVELSSFGLAKICDKTLGTQLLVKKKPEN